MSTLVVYANENDGWIRSVDGFDDYDFGFPGNYALARAGTGYELLPFSSGFSCFVGQFYTPGSEYPTYTVYEAVESFDTSALGAGASVSAAVLRLYGNADNSTTDFTVEARLHDWGTTLTTADYVAGASLSSKTLLAHYPTSGGISSGTGYDFIDDALPANVNKTGSTRLLLCSSRTTNNNTPTGNEHCSFKAADTTGTTEDPVLTITYTAGGGLSPRSQIVMVG